MKHALVALLIVAAGLGIWYWYSRPKPDTRRLAPAGVYFLTQRISLNSDAGVQSFPGGTRVQQVSETGDMLRVREGTTEFDVARKKLTNDLDVAEAAARHDATSLRRFEAWKRQQELALTAQRRKEGQDVEHLEALRRQRELPPIGSTPNPLDRESYNRHP